MDRIIRNCFRMSCFFSIDFHLLVILNVYVYLGTTAEKLKMVGDKNDENDIIMRLSYLATIQ